MAARTDGPCHGGGNRATHARVRNLLHQHDEREHERDAG
jgi:hypothetical protein